MRCQSSALYGAECKNAGKHVNYRQRSKGKQKLYCLIHSQKIKVVPNNNLGMYTIPLSQWYGIKNIKL